MITKLISIGAILAGMTLSINGITVKANDILDRATLVSAQANLSQFRTALDLYFLDHGNYPNVAGSEAMFYELKSGNYIRENAPVNMSQFDYQPQNNGQDYLLEITPG